MNRMGLKQSNPHGILTSVGGQKEVRRVGRNSNAFMIRNKAKVAEMKNPIQRQRVLANMRQKDLAEAIGRTVSYIGRVECGSINVNSMSMRMGYQIAQVLGCRMEDLIDREELAQTEKVQ